MVRRNLYQREDVVAAAVSVVREDGFAQLSARRVAERLGASTAPVYSNFANMDELAQAVKLAIADLVVAETEVCRSGEPFLDMGIGVLAFARSHPGLYAAVFMPGADEAEAGYDIAALRKRGRRPHGDGPARVVPVRLDDTLLNALDERAEHDRVTRSELIRAALRAYVA